MIKKEIANGTVHKTPTDLKETLASDPTALATWQSLTPLTRNEWVCWTVTVKQQKTRDNHVKRVVSELKDGVRRPCCWLGCIHRTDKEVSPSVRWLLDKQAKSK